MERIKVDVHTHTHEVEAPLKLTNRAPNNDLGRTNETMGEMHGLLMVLIANKADKFQMMHRSTSSLKLTLQRLHTR